MTFACHFLHFSSLLEKRLDAALQERDFIDVVFNKTSVEAGFTVEAVSVMQVLIEPTFLKTCCFYINDIVERKVRVVDEKVSKILADFSPEGKLENLSDNVTKSKFPSS